MMNYMESTSTHKQVGIIVLYILVLCLTLLYVTSRYILVTHPSQLPIDLFFKIFPQSLEYTSIIFASHFLISRNQISPIIQNTNTSILITSFLSSTLGILETPLLSVYSNEKSMYLSIIIYIIGLILAIGLLTSFITWANKYLNNYSVNKNNLEQIEIVIILIANTIFEIYLSFPAWTKWFNSIGKVEWFRSLLIPIRLAVSIYAIIAIVIFLYRYFKKNSNIPGQPNTTFSQT